MNEGQEVKENPEVEEKNAQAKDAEGTVAEEQPVVTAEAEEGGETETAMEPTPESRVDELERKCRDFQNQFLRARADLENYRKRTERERQDAVKFANRDILNRILSVLDNFERAVEHAPDKTDNFFKGVEMIQKQLSDVLTQSGVEEIAAAGKAFDPYLHEAFAYEPTADHPEHQIIEVFQKGYRYKGSLLRPAKVKVAAALPAQAESEEAGDAGEA